MTLIKRTLMQRNRELADFEFDLATCKARVIDAAPAGDDLPVSADLVQQGDNQALNRLVQSRSISSRRPDIRDILASFGAHSPVHLALMGHGLSLSDQYWYRAPGSTERWEDINFFDNEWDQGFGAAVLAGDYARLATCSPDVPDATTCGAVVKAWERIGDGVFLAKVSERPDGADLASAKLASELCGLLFDEGCYVPVEIAERNGQPCSVSPLMLEADDVLVDGHRLCAISGTQEEHRREDRGRLTPERCRIRIEAYTALGISDASAQVAKLACLSCLALLANFHTENFGAICKINSGVWRAAPIFDYGGSFGFFHGKCVIPEKLPSLFFFKLLCASHFSFLDPSWDWSWFDPRVLEGFEDRIMEAYAPYRDLAPHFSGLVASTFSMQRKYVNGVASGDS